jgi:hypothetical protein
MTDLPNKIISSRDLARINHLMDALPTDSQSELDNLRLEVDRAIVVAPERIPTCK